MKKKEIITTAIQVAQSTKRLLEKTNFVYYSIINSIPELHLRVSTTYKMSREISTRVT